MPFPLSALGLGQFARGGAAPWAGTTPYEWYQQQQYPQGPDPNDPRPQRGDFQPMDQFQATLRDWQQRQSPGSVEPGRPGAWRPMPGQPPRQLGGFDPEGMPPVPGQPTTGPSYDDYVRGGGGFMPPMGQGQLPPMGSAPGHWGNWSPGQGQGLPYGQPKPPWMQQPSGYGQMPLGQFGRGGWGGAFGGAFGGLGGMFGFGR